MSTKTDPKRIVIVGGGISALLTAFELTATPELCARHQVTIYQMGWRLGGKLSSGANPAMGFGQRNEEHGLHVWFGFYDNAFNDIAKCYTELLKLQPMFKYPTCFDAFKPNDYTPIGHRTHTGYGWWPVHWPLRSGTPGQYDASNLFDSPLAILRAMLAWLRDFLDGEIGLVNFVDHDFTRTVDEFAKHAEGFAKRPMAISPNSAGLNQAINWLDVIESLETKDVYPSAVYLVEYLKKLKAHYIERLTFLGFGDPDLHPFRSLVELVTTCIVGLLNPKYGWLKDYNLNRIDHLDYRAWLIANGGDKKTVNQSSYIRALYDIPFAYENGDLTRPNFAAGAAMRWAFRTAFTYRGHAMYVPQCGFGEAVIAPYYEVLRARGVRFEFFHKLTRAQLTANKKTVQSLTFAVQARTSTGAPYEPVTFSGGLYHWPITPDWAQLDNGPSLAGRNVDFESHWNNEPPVSELTLHNGANFDHVVIALAGAVWKRLNHVDTPPVADLLDASAAFAAAASSLGIVATAGVQLWMKKSTKNLGWSKPPATVGGPEPLDVWADMSQVLAVEGWTGENKPKSLHYLCGPVDTTLFAAPSTDPTVPAQAKAAVVRLTRDWIDQFGGTNWPGAAANGGGLDYDALFDPANGSGAARLDTQYLRANVSPTECCGTSFAGTTKHRVSADDFLFTNVSIVGADTNTGINVTCVEGATISARKASRAICGSPKVIPGEHFMAGGFPP